MGTLIFLLQLLNFFRFFSYYAFINLFIMDDWDTHTVIYKRQPTTSQFKSKQAVNQAQRSGATVDTNKKWAAGQNKQHTITKNTMKLDQETEELHHDTVSLDVAKIIQRARSEKGWSQKDLATRINEKPQVVNDYEAARAVPNNQVMSKLERTLGVKLRGKDKGQPMAPPTKKK